MKNDPVTRPVTGPVDRKEPTSTPWTLSDFTQIHDSSGNRLIASCDSKGYWENDEEKRLKQDKANAELIVSCVNQNKSLLDKIARLETALNEISKTKPKIWPNKYET